MSEEFYKVAEKRILQWLDRPEEGYCIDRIPDQMNGLYGSKNIADFIFFKSPDLYYIESKATWADRFDFSMITQYQHDKLIEKSKIPNVHGIVIVLFASAQKAVILNILDIKSLEDSGVKSLNINKIDKWKIPYLPIKTVPSRKQILDYDKSDNVL